MQLVLGPDIFIYLLFSVEKAIRDLKSFLINVKSFIGQPEHGKDVPDSWNTA